MRGQVTIEFILVAAIMLGALSVWLPGVLGAQEAISAAMGAQHAAIAADRLSAAINAACVMGPGNEVEARLSLPGRVDFSYAGNFTMFWNNRTFERTSHCAFEGFSVEGTRTLLFRNRAGVIRTA